MAIEQYGPAPIGKRSRQVPISDLVASKADAAEDNPDDPVEPGSKVSRGHQCARTLQVRLTDGDYPHPPGP